MLDQSHDRHIDRVPAETGYTGIMIEPDQLTRAAYAIFVTQMTQANVPPVDANQSINEFWTYEWERNMDDYRAQAAAAFTAVGLEVNSDAVPDVQPEQPFGSSPSHANGHQQP